MGGGAEDLVSLGGDKIWRGLGIMPHVGGQDGKAPGTHRMQEGGVAIVGSKIASAFTDSCMHRM